LRGDRPQGGDRPFRSDRPQRDDRPGGGARQFRSGRPQSGDRSFRSDRGSDRPQRGPRPSALATPAIPEDVTGTELDRDVRMALSSLSSFTSKEVARHLVMVGRLIDDDPEAAWQHALAARARAARIGVVREAAGLAAYRAGHYADAVAELRTARRLTGSDEHLPVIADCERALGRPERALTMAASPDVGRLGVDQRVEMLIVEAGARADLGQLDAAVITLQVGLLDSRVRAPWVARLRSAYADALAAVGRDLEARRWLERAAEADPDDVTGIGERLEELDGLVLTDLEDEDEDDNEDDNEDQDQVEDQVEVEDAGSDGGRDEHA
jgi:tetratricopeptide (TPR) repeat protein